MLNAYNLYALSICHVCGSYQCPYCPNFSGALELRPHFFAVLAAVLVGLLCLHSSRKLSVGRNR